MISIHRPPKVDVCQWPLLRRHLLHSAADDRKPTLAQFAAICGIELYGCHTAGKMGQATHDVAVPRANLRESLPSYDGGKVVCNDERTPNRVFVDSLKAS
eukprot:7319210-Prymnesium_polylepis.2